MNRLSFLLAAFVAVAAIQLAVPAWVIVRRELALRHGVQFKFRTEPVDPADVFRGRYVQLRLEPDRVTVPDCKRWQYNQRAYAILSADTNGFALVTGLQRTPPSGRHAIKVRVGWPDVNSSQVHFSWPMDRYYMEESKAAAAETAYREHSSRTNRNCHITVMVRSGTAVIENLFIVDRPVRDYIEKK
jgi:uncharacterized membrane-anchored protein